jgi:hypothetical protein
VQGLLPQAAPTAASTSFGSGFSGQLAASNSSGSASYATAATSPQVSVSAAGAITAPASTPGGVYGVGLTVVVVDAWVTVSVNVQVPMSPAVSLSVPRRRTLRWSAGR